ncbi:hypothetical protein FMN50_16505 [Rhodobacterales bacterium]|nr:hypothetical protein FMN50_16505 [Rhodobacterales bacterium]
MLVVLHLKVVPKRFSGLRWSMPPLDPPKTLSNRASATNGAVQPVRHRLDDRCEAEFALCLTRSEQR